MNLKDQINADLKEAMKSQDKVRLNTIRSIRALILEFEKSGANKAISEEDAIKMLSTAAKKRREAIEQYENAGRSELAEIEKSELAIIETYLPKQLSEDEILTKVKQFAEEIGATSKADFGKMMGVVMQKLKGQADGNVIRKIVEQVLS
ncbi:MAG: GatB/YqeY domain-containing protein [Ignavibacteriae bacterium]|nr:GatB/YqeY domain-containing protein [Ignavibacteriota bacterium]MCB9206917.1 GatB/YqeY domain-containing protein [Ignavibacteriales bacterium]MCB9209825.1 GatB/YqeY domain-containing protein [Ignavibacteriales bacterium]MCB9218981.1 GatB/YqeY domain-containing protein [Ignavibacteriales bacterium]